MKRLSISFAVLAMLFLIASSALAQQSWKTRREAQKLAAEAKALVKRGDFKKAAKKYRKADELTPAPSYKLELARMLVELEDFVQAGEVLHKAVEAEPKQFEEKVAKKKAEALLKEVGQRTPTLEITVFKPEAAAVRITVDGDDFEPGDGAVPYNPGKYEVAAEAKGYAPWTKTVKLREGDHETVEVTMKAAAAGPAEEEESSGGGMSRVPAYVAWGTGVVALGVGVGFGIAAIGATNDVLQLYKCENSVCPPEAESDLDVAKMNGNISTAGFVIGGVAVATGTILFLLADDGEGDAEGDEDEVPEDEGMLKIEARPIVGPGFVGLTGSF